MRRLLDDIQKNITTIFLVLGLWIGLNALFENFCPMVLILGFPCPGCGLTRAFYELLKLNPLVAFQYNPTYPLWLILILSAIWRRYIKGLSLFVLRIPLAVVVIITILVYVLRMIYVFPGNPPMVFEEKNCLSIFSPAYNVFVKSHII